MGVYWSQWTDVVEEETDLDQLTPLLPLIQKQYTLDQLAQIYGKWEDKEKGKYITHSIMKKLFDLTEEEARGCFRCLDVRGQGTRISIISVLTFLALLTPEAGEEGKARTSTLPTSLEHDSTFFAMQFVIMLVNQIRDCDESDLRPNTRRPNKKQVCLKACDAQFLISEMVDAIRARFPSHFWKQPSDSEITRAVSVLFDLENVCVYPSIPRLSHGCQIDKHGEVVMPVVQFCERILLSEYTVRLMEMFADKSRFQDDYILPSPKASAPMEMALGTRFGDTSPLRGNSPVSRGNSPVSRRNQGFRTPRSARAISALLDALDGGMPVTPIGTPRVGSRPERSNSPGELRAPMFTPEDSQPDNTNPPTTSPGENNMKSQKANNPSPPPEKVRESPPPSPPAAQAQRDRVSFAKDIKTGSPEIPEDENAEEWNEGVRSKYDSVGDETVYFPIMAPDGLYRLDWTKHLLKPLSVVPLRRRGWKPIVPGGLVIVPPVDGFAAIQRRCAEVNGKAGLKDMVAKSKPRFFENLTSKQINTLRQIFQRGDKEKNGLLEMPEFLYIVEKAKTIDKDGFLHDVERILKTCLSPEKFQGFKSFPNIISYLCPLLHQLRIMDMIAHAESKNKIRGRKAQVLVKKLQSGFQKAVAMSRLNRQQTDDDDDDEYVSDSEKQPVSMDTMMDIHGLFNQIDIRGTGKISRAQFCAFFSDALPEIREVEEKLKF